MCDTEMLKTNVTDIVDTYKIENILFENKKASEEDWGIGEGLSYLLENMLQMVDTEYKKLSSKTKSGMNSYDGYLMPLEGDRYIRVMRVKDGIMGMVYYFSGYAVRVIGESETSEYSCSMYETDVIRGGVLNG